MLTLTQLLKATPKLVRENTRQTKVTNAKFFINKRTGCIRMEAKVQRFLNDGIVHQPHKVEVWTFRKGDGVLSQSPVKVSCDCGLQVFYGAEWVLHQKGAADIKYGNGDPPDINNPSRRYYLCHHLAKVAKILLEKGI